VIDRWGQLGPDIARGLQLRHDWGPQYRSGHFLGSIAWLGIADNAAFLGEPETNGCAERWIRTLKEQCLWAELHDTIDQLRQAVSGFVDRYNHSWLIGRHGHQTRRRPTRQLKRPQRHDQVGTTSVQETGRCSGGLVRRVRFLAVRGRRGDQLGDHPEQLQPPVKTQWLSPLGRRRSSQRLGALDPDADQHISRFAGSPRPAVPTRTRPTYGGAGRWA
jgi:Integrase core domain